MATLYATMQQPPEAAIMSIRQQAPSLGYAIDEGAGGLGLLVLTKGITLVSWGSKLSVRYEPDPGGGTRLTITTDEVFALTDWGRGRRAVGKLLDAIGAEAIGR